SGFRSATNDRAGGRTTEMVIAPSYGASHLRSEWRWSRQLSVNSMRRLALALLCVSLPRPVLAQQRDTIVVRAQLPRDVAVEVVSLFNATTAMRTTERTDIAAGRDVAGDVAVLDGPLTIAGHVAGRVLAINSDVILARG